MRAPRPRDTLGMTLLLGLAVAHLGAGGALPAQEPAAASDSAALAPRAELDAERIRTGTFRYGIMLQGTKFGKYELEFEERDGDYRLEEEASGHAGEQSGTYTFTRGLAPLTARQQGSLGDVSAELRLRYEAGRVTGEATLPGDRPEEGGPPRMEEIAIDTAVAEGTIDASMGLSAVLASPLSAGFDLRLPLYDPRQGIVALVARVTGEETVEVPAGRFDAYRIEMSAGRSSLVLFVTREAPRVMVRQEFAGQPVVFLLEDIDD